jgi:hypothetical protein
MFSVNSAGDVILRQQLDYEREDFYRFLVHVTDGRTVSPLTLFRCCRTGYFSLRERQKKNRILMGIFVGKWGTVRRANSQYIHLFKDLV